MNRTQSFVSAFGAGIVALSSLTGVAQTAPAPAPAAPSTAPAPVQPHAVDAKIALIAFEQVVVATNEGMRTVQDVQKKYEPKKAALDTLGNEAESLRKQLATAPATMPEEEKASRQRALDVKEKQYQRDAEDAQTAYNADLQEALGKVAQKVSGVMRQYVKQNGYTLLLDVGGQGSNVLWADEGTDVSQAVVTAYNAASGVAAPMPSAPGAARPRTSTTPKPAPSK
jgi:Skp family chaperone for outer membrane proteins